MKPKYNKSAVNKQLAKDKVKNPKAKALTHRLLKGRQKTDEPNKDSADAKWARKMNRQHNDLEYDRNFGEGVSTMAQKDEQMSKTGMKKTVKEAAEKIACTKCDEVSTKAAWKKNDGTCPKCKKSSQGVAEAQEVLDLPSELIGEDGYKYPNSIKGKGKTEHDPSGIDNRQKRKAFRKKQKAAAHKKRMAGEVEESKLTEGVLDDMDDDGFMAKRQLYDLAKSSVALHKLIQDTDNLEPWIQAKITKASDYIETVHHYMEYKSVRDADETADTMGPPDMADMADMDMVGDELASLGPVEEQEEIIESGSDLNGWDILRMANGRGLISPETYADPELELFNTADWFAQELGDMEEFGSSDISIWMKNFAEELRANGINLDGANAHLYESAMKANSIYKNMLKDLRKSK